ncbi:MAG: hypothetical protein K6E49_08310 [Lachnospiraceae bacterium]|nr:hypothetical protein [Lachnospiraceae bacterium]
MDKLKLFDYKLEFDIGDVALVLGATFFQLFSNGDAFSSFYYSLLYLAVYQLGKRIAAKGKYEPEVKSAVAVFLIALVWMIRGLINYSMRPQGETEDWVGWGRDGIVTPRTQFEGYLVLMAAFLGFFVILILKKKFVMGVIGIAMSLVCIYTATNVNGRFALGAAVCAGACVIFMYYIDTKAYRTVVGRILLILLAVGIASIPVMYAFNILGFRTRYEGSFLSGSGGIFTNVRFLYFVQQIKLFWERPNGSWDVPLFGYYSYDKGYYVHNFWLDEGRFGSVYSAIAFVIFTVTNIVSAFKVWLRSKSVYKYALLSVFVGITMYMALEVVIFRIYVITVSIFIGGLLRGVVNSMRTQEGAQRTGFREILVGFEWR